MKILVLDVGGTHVKMYFSGAKEVRKFDSGAKMTPRELISQVRALTKDWSYDAVSIGFPSPIITGKILHEPNNLGAGWMHFDFEKALKKPAKIINDAAMQAIGSYDGKRMLFLGLGTGLGSALILDHVVVPLELGELHFSKSKNIEAAVSKAQCKKIGARKWEANVHEAIGILRKAFVVDYLVLGGGNASKLKTLPQDARLGANKNAFAGGERLWDRHTRFAYLQNDRLVIV